MDEINSSLTCPIPTTRVIKSNMKHVNMKIYHNDSDEPLEKYQHRESPSMIKTEAQ